jgi:hypothetical protein
VAAATLQVLSRLLKKWLCVGVGVGVRGEVIGVSQRSDPLVFFCQVGFFISFTRAAEPRYCFLNIS